MERNASQDVDYPLSIEPAMAKCETSSVGVKT